MSEAHSTESAFATQFKVGLFTLLGLALIGAVTVYVNDRPYWWRSCQYVSISVDDATGLKAKSPIRSLGLQIGYLKDVELSETYVRLGICITAPVEVLPSTRAYIKGEGFLGDKFVELKPVRYLGRVFNQLPKQQKTPIVVPSVKEPEGKTTSQLFRSIWKHLKQDLSGVAHAEAANEPDKKSGREIPVGERSQDMQHIVNQVDGLVTEMTHLTNNLKEAINPQELKKTMTQLNKALENASKTLSPEGGLNTTAQRTLSKLEDAIEQIRDQMMRVNRGEGSVGMLLNDPSYAEEIRSAIKNINSLLSRVGGVRFMVDIGMEKLPAYEGSRGWFRLGIWPQEDRYYLLGVSADARGKRSTKTTRKTVDGVLSTTIEEVNEEGGLLISAMMGRIFWHRLELAAGLLNGDATGSIVLRVGPRYLEDIVQVRSDVYSSSKAEATQVRWTGQVRPFYGSKYLNTVYLRGGMESMNKVGGKSNYFYGAGLSFDDESIKLLFALFTAGTPGT